jgi:phosphoribosyl-AMP cyclohydrolase
MWGENAMSRLQWDFFEYLPVVLQDAATRDVLMVQYMTRGGPSALAGGTLHVAVEPLT